MSFCVYLEDENGNPYTVDRHTEGGTYAIGGTPDAELDVTYNYSPHYYKCLNEKEGLRWLNGRQANDTIEALRHAVRVLGTERDDDYWKNTPGNAGHALNILVSWAKQHPEGVWRVS